MCDPNLTLGIFIGLHDGQLCSVCLILSLKGKDNSIVHAVAYVHYILLKSITKETTF